MSIFVGSALLPASAMFKIAMCFLSFPVILTITEVPTKKLSFS